MTQIGILVSKLCRDGRIDDPDMSNILLDPKALLQSNMDSRHGFDAAAGSETPTIFLAGPPSHLTADC